MTKAQLYAAIDLIFDDNAEDNSIKPSDEGAKLKQVVDYVDQQVLIGVEKTHAPVNGGSVAPYPVLTFDSNVIYTNNVNDRVVLPATTKIGKEVLVFALNNGNSFSVMADQEGSSKISSAGISSTSSSLSVGPNISVRFIHLNNGYWKAEMI